MSENVKVCAKCGNSGLVCISKDTGEMRYCSLCGFGDRQALKSKDGIHIILHSKNLAIRNIQSETSQLRTKIAELEAEKVGLERELGPLQEMKKVMNEGQILYKASREHPKVKPIFQTTERLLAIWAKATAKQKRGGE